MIYTGKSLTNAYVYTCIIEKIEITHTHKIFFNVFRKMPPDEDIADMHDRVKHFCGVKNEELLEKLRSAAGLAKMVATIN